MDQIYARRFHSQYFGRGTGRVAYNDDKQSGEIILEFTQPVQTQTFTFLVDDFCIAGPQHLSTEERLLRSAIARLHRDVKRRGETPPDNRLDAENPPWIGDLHPVGGEGGGAVPGPQGLEFERRHDAGMAAVVYKAIEQDRPDHHGASRLMLKTAEVPTAVIRRVLSSRPKRRAGGEY